MVLCVCDGCGQAMVHDLLKSEDDLVSIEPDNKKDAGVAPAAPASGGVKKKDQFLLNEADHLWVEFRHQHIARVGGWVRGGRPSLPPSLWQQSEHACMHPPRPRP